MTDEGGTTRVSAATGQPGAVLAGEIAEQPTAVARFLREQREAVRALVARLPAFSYVVVAARGSSDHVGEYARYLLPMLWGTPVAPSTPSLHTHYRTPPRFDHALVLGISQSGQSPDVVGVVAEARAQGRPTIAITNDPDSPLARAAAHVVPLHAGPEASIAATKTYTCQLAALALLAAARARASVRLDELDRIPEAMQRTLDLGAGPAHELARAWRAIDRCLVLARGIALGSAHEIALKLRELLRLHTVAFSAADFRHGSVALLEPGLPALVLAPEDAARADALALAGTLREGGADVAIVGPVAAPGCAHLPLPADVPSWLSPLVAVLPAQQLALAIARARGGDPDRPAGLTAKVVRTT